MFERRVLTMSTALVLLATALLPACLDDSGQPDEEAIASGLPETPIARPTASATPPVEPSATPAAWLVELLTPGDTATARPSIYFRNGPDVWRIDNELTVTQITRQRRVGAIATRPDGEQAAALFLESIGGRQAEEIRLVDAVGAESEPVYGPEIVGNPGGNPSVTMIVWSPDGSSLAVVRDDGSIRIVGPGREAVQLLPGQDHGPPEQLVWAPNGAAVALLTRDAEGAGSISIIPISGEGRVDIAPAYSYGALAWLPAQARLAVSEDRGAGPHPFAGSLFTLRPDGSDRSLLVSAGEFGPTIGMSHLRPSPDGAWLAFVIHAPDNDGQLRFQSLYLLEIGTGVLRQLPVSPGLGVTDLWWSQRGVAWRAINLELGSSYNGVEPFVIEVFDLNTGETELIYTTSGT